MIFTTDYFIGALIGFLAGTFAIPTFLNLGAGHVAIFLALPWALAPLFAIGVWFGGLLSRWLPFMAQFGKFAAVGFLNTTIDFGILNMLSAITGLTAGLVIGEVNVPGFLAAVVNGYFWNKYWVFRARTGSTLHDFPKFLVVSVIGLLINSGMVILVTTYREPFFGADARIWLNVAKAAATATALVWNFMGYKFLVFRGGVAKE